MVKTIDGKALQGLYQRSECAKAALDHFAERENRRATTTVEALQTALRADGYSHTRTEVIDLFKELDSLGCGQFKVGRKGHSSRIEWTVHLKSVGQAARGTGIVEPLAERDIEELQEAESEEDSLQDRELEHVFMLRPSYKLTLELPKDLTHAEAARIADFIRTLPFEPQR